jgi:ubiquinone/menaquinone biosynthesis C-methylase UbiE
MKGFLFTVLLLASFMVFPQKKPVFSYKVYGNIANYFENESDLLTYFDFKKGNWVAEVGAYKGENLGGLSLLTDSITFYAEDINSNSLNEASLNKIIRQYKKYKNPPTCQFKLCIGDEKTTMLPDNTFDKILLSATFHEFTFMDEMMADIYKKLKPGGKLYILESHCFTKTHKNYTAEEAIAIAEKFNFKLLKKDGKDLNGGSGLYRLVFYK